MVQDFTTQEFCTFCKIVRDDTKKEIETRIGDSIVVTPHEPQASFHRLVIYKQHVPSPLESTQSFGKVMRDAAEYVKRLTKGHGGRYTILGHTYPGLSEQNVLHLHVHVIQEGSLPLQHRGGARRSHHRA